MVCPVSCCYSFFDFLLNRVCLSPDVVKHTGNFTVTKQVYKAVAIRIVSLLYKVRNWVMLSIVTTLFPRLVSVYLKNKTHGYYLQINHTNGR